MAQVSLEKTLQEASRHTYVERSQPLDWTFQTVKIGESDVTAQSSWRKLSVSAKLFQMIREPRLRANWADEARQKNTVTARWVQGKGKG